jgi:hypothetical protein
MISSKDNRESATGDGGWADTFRHNSAEPQKNKKANTSHTVSLNFIDLSPIPDVPVTV